jgi:hypothetical protein
VVDDLVIGKRTVVRVRPGFTFLFIRILDFPTAHFKVDFVKVIFENGSLQRRTGSHSTLSICFAYILGRLLLEILGAPDTGILTLTCPGIQGKPPGVRGS